MVMCQHGHALILQPVFYGYFMYCCAYYTMLLNFDVFYIFKHGYWVDIRDARVIGITITSGSQCGGFWSGTLIYDQHQRETAQKGYTSSPSPLLADHHLLPYPVFL